MTWRFQREDWDPSERKEFEAYLDKIPDGTVSAELLELATATVDRHFSTREAFNLRLSGTATFAGALLAVALTQGKNAGEVGLTGAVDVLFTIAFIGAIVLLVGAISVALWSLRPSTLTPLQTGDLAEYAVKEKSMKQVRIDMFKLHILNIEELSAGNGKRSRGLVIAQYLVGAALALAGAGAALIFFAT